MNYTVNEMHIETLEKWQHGHDFSLIHENHTPQSMEHYRGLISEFTELSHITIEVITCIDGVCPG